jgi:hypothetical protein
MPIWGAHIEMGINAHKGNHRRRGCLQERCSEEESQRSRCSMAKRVAAVREFTPSLW